MALVGLESGQAPGEYANSSITNGHKLKLKKGNIINCHQILILCDSYFVCFH